MPNKKADPIGDVAAQILAGDSEIKERMRKLVNALIDDAFYIIKFGTPQERAALTRAVVPAFLRSMRGADANAEEAERRAAYERMMAVMRGEET